MNVRCCCLEWDFLWWVTKSRAGCLTLWSINSLIDQERVERPDRCLWICRDAGEVPVFCVWASFFFFLKVCLCLQPGWCVRLVHIAHRVCLWETARFPHLRKDNVLHSTGEQSHYRSRNSSLEATALPVVWMVSCWDVLLNTGSAITGAPMLQTLPSPCFSAERRKKSSLNTWNCLSVTPKVEPSCFTCSSDPLKGDYTRL